VIGCNPITAPSFLKILFPENELPSYSSTQRYR
jgi:hypothetical protein